jgi:hypothetical protein
MFGWNKSCHWSHDWENWGELVSRQWQAYGTSDQTFVRNYQRRTCKRCGRIEERLV